MAVDLAAALHIHGAHHPAVAGYRSRVYRLPLRHDKVQCPKAKCASLRITRRLPSDRIYVHVHTYPNVCGHALGSLVFL
jgi:hypothetical protein